MAQLKNHFALIGIKGIIAQDGETGEALSGMLYGFSFEHYVAADVNIINLVNQQVGGVTVTIPEGMEKTNPYLFLMKKLERNLFGL